MQNKVALLILDGWGIGDRSPSDAIFHAHTPFVDKLFLNYPSSQLLTSGEQVGLPEGQMGNSEVGHLNLGAGRIVYQELSRINNAIKDGSFFENPTLLNALHYAQQQRKKVHLLGLVSHGGVHSSLTHLEALIALCKQMQMQRVHIHAITDGRDCSPTTAVRDLAYLQTILNDEIKLSTIIGRYFAMDRDNRWERIAQAYHLLVHGKGTSTKDPIEAINLCYNQGITDEFLPPFIVEESGLMASGDVVICFNFRTDRPRQITQVLTQKAYPEHNMSPIDLHFVTMTNYDDTFTHVNVVFEKDNLENTLGEIVSKAGLRQVRIAETEKYPHVTYFFNGGREEPFEHEDRLMVPSPKVSTYDLQPQMSAVEVTDTLLSYISTQQPSFICLNYANPDMVGHTGVFSAIVKAVETIDAELEKLVKFLEAQGYDMLILADHGNAEQATNPDGSPNTSHTLNPVPCILVGKTPTLELESGILADVAPTILELLNLAQPAIMTGKSLIKKGAKAPKLFNS
jgi:2,3-bisphosphoglycerate-independent phosphoglycerate mutase